MNTESNSENTSGQAKPAPRIVVKVSGGIVTGTVSDVPCEIMVLDYDVNDDGATAPFPEQAEFERGELGADAANAYDEAPLVDAAYCNALFNIADGPQPHMDDAPAASAPADVAVIRNALAGADDFIGGFADDETQEPGSIAAMQNDIAAAFGEVSKLVDERDAWTAQRAALLHGVESAAQTITESSARETRQAKALSIYLTFANACVIAGMPLAHVAATAIREAAAAQAGQ